MGWRGLPLNVICVVLVGENISAPKRNVYDRSESVACELRRGYLLENAICFRGKVIISSVVLQ